MLDLRALYLVIRRAVYAVLAELDRQFNIKQSEK